MDVLLKSIPLYINQEEIQKLQSQPNAEELVANQVSAVISELASELLASVANELSSPNVHGCVKDLTRAEELRTSGNALFIKGKYQEAIKQFSESLRFLNSSSSSSNLESEACAKVLCNRALCLSKHKLHQLAIDDATYAISIKPDHAKAYYRRSISYRELNNICNARKDATRALQLLKQQNASTIEAEELLSGLLEHCTIDDDGGGCNNGGNGGGKQEEQPVWTTHSVPQDLWNEQEDDENGTTNNTKLQGTTSSSASVPEPIDWSCSLPEISKLIKNKVLEKQNSIEITESPRLGRHLIVGTQQLQGSTDFIKDVPVAHALSKQRRLDHCGHCCKTLPLDGAYFWPCSACALAVFCSTECRDHEDVHHVAGGAECGVPWTALLPPVVVLAVRLACRLKRDQEAMNVNSDQDANASNEITSNSSRVVASLQTCFSKMDTEEAIWNATTACAAHAAYTIAYQRSSANNKLNRAGNTAVPISIADILRALCIIKINGLAIVPQAFGSAEESIGIAVYPITSFLSHSCIPNVSVRFDGSTAIIRTLSTLAPGTALLHCYGPQAGEMTTAQRRMMLNDQYHFLCECDGCVVRSGGTDKEESLKEAEMVGLKCTATKGCVGAMQVPLCTSAHAITSNNSTLIIDAGLLSKYDLSIKDENSFLNKSGGCTTCGAQLSEVDWNSKIAPRLAKALESYSTGCKMLDMMEHGQIQENLIQVKKAVELLEESLKIRQELLHKHNQVLGATHYALSWVSEFSSSNENITNKMENRRIVHTRASLENAERLFPADSTNIAYEKLKLGTMLQETGSKDAVKQGKELVSAAMATLERHFGKAPAEEQTET